MKVIVVGCGYWGKNLVRNFNDLGHLYGILISIMLLRMNSLKNSQSQVLPLKKHANQMQMH